MQSDERTLFNELAPSKRPRRKKAKSQPVFKNYNQDQIMLLPPQLDELIPDNHLVRVVNKTIDGLNLDPLIATYEGGGTSSYHPKMLLKGIIYAYVSKIYSSRKIAKAFREDINFYWLSAMSFPDFRTINNFRSGRLKKVIDQVFGETVLFLVNYGYIDLQEYFVDGTKIRADNNKHKIIWAKNTKRYKELVQQKIKERLREIERINNQENERYGDRDLEELGEDKPLNSKALKEHIGRLNEILKKKQAPKQSYKALKEIQKQHLPKLEKYEQQEQMLTGRNSCGRTDPQATAFRTKDGQLLPAYNVIIGTQRQFIINYSFNQRKGSESDGFIPHLKRLKKIIKKYPKLVMGDSAFGSEENYSYLKQKRIGNYLKYNTFHKEKTKKYRSDPYRKEHFPYNSDTDTYTCPEGRSLVFKEHKQITTNNGYHTSVQIYKCVNCDGCTQALACKQGSGPRSIQINPILDRYRCQARENLNSERGITLRKQRSIDVEPPFADIKFNQNYQRFRLRGESKVNIEFGLLSIAHNTKKIAQRLNS